VATRRAILPDLAGIWGVVTFLTLTAIAGSKALKDGDTLWHIKMGQVMLERGEVLKNDIFSHTAFGQPWHAHEWLSEVIMALIHDWAGLAGVALFYFAVFGLTLTLLLKIAGRLAGDLPSIISITLALPCIYIHLLARPHVFTWFGAVATLYLLERGGRWLWWLVPLSAFWANLHGGVLFGLVVQLIVLFGSFLDHLNTTSFSRLSFWWEANKRPASILALCILAACLTPFGYEIFIFPFKVASPVFTQGISEWKSPDFQELWFARAWIVIIVFMSLWLGRGLAWRWHLLSLFLLWQTLGHVRNLSVAAILLVPCLAILVRDLGNQITVLFKRNTDRTDLSLSPWTGPLLVVVLATALTFLIGKDTLGMRDLAEEHFQPPKDYRPAMNFLEAGFPAGNLLNDYEWGDYLLYGIDPPPKVFIDGRADMYGEEIFTDYGKMAQLDEETEDLLKKYKIDWVFFPKDHIINRYLKKCGSWRTIYEDEFTEILIRSATDTRHQNQF